MKSVHDPLTILMVTNNYTPYSGGVVRSIDVFADQLRKQGHFVFIVTLDFTGSHDDDPEVIRISCPVKFMYRQKHIALPWSSETQLNDIVRRVKPDIIHAHHPFLLGVSACTVAQRYKIPITFTYHTLYEKYTHYVPLPEMVVQPVTIRRVLSFCRSVNHIIVPNSSLQSYLHGKRVRTPLSVVPSPIAHHFYQPVARRIQPDEPIRLISVSRFAKEKNIEWLLDAFAACDQIRYQLTLVGYGDHLSFLQAYAYKTLKLSHDAVTFIVQPEQAELVRLYQQALMFVFASQTETQGLVLGEAMAMGLPVIALHGPGQRDIVRTNYNGFLIEHHDHLSHVLETIRTDCELYEQLQHGAVHSASEYMPATLTDRLVQVYRSCMY